MKKLNLLIILTLTTLYSNGQLLNVALNKPATASGTYNTSTAAKAFDGLNPSSWGTAANTGWIQVDLQGSYTINNINLLVDQTPNGTTTHKIYTAPNITGTWTLVETITGVTSKGQLLERCYQSNPLLNVGAVKIETTNSPSWVSWTEIGIFATLSSGQGISASGPLSFANGGSVTLTASPGTSYLWSNGATTQSITVSTSDTYSVTIGQPAIVNGTSTCRSFSAPTFSAVVNVADLATGIEDGRQYQNGLFSIYPNPSNEKITISLQDMIFNYQVKILELNGRVLYNNAMVGDKLEIDVSRFSQGIYQLILNDAKSVITKKIIIY